MTISFVVAMSRNRVIGVNNQLPWKIPTDMARFTRITTGHPVVMGSKTYESFPEKYRPLPNRTNIVMTRDASKKFPGAHAVTSLAEAIRLAAQQSGGEEIMLIGGGQVFEEALPLTHKIYLTEVDTEVENGDAFFPELDELRWDVKDEGAFEADEKNQYGGRFLTYTRSNSYPIVEPANGRNEEYKAQLNGILESGQCPFCPGGETLRDQEILKQTDTWFVKENAHPLANTLFHFVFTPNRHVQDVGELTAKEWEGLMALRQELKEKYNFTGDAMYVRSGEPLVTGATVAHLHWHLIVPAGHVQVSFGRFSKR